MEVVIEEQRNNKRNKTLRGKTSRGCVGKEVDMKNTTGNFTKVGANMTYNIERNTWVIRSLATIREMLERERDMNNN